MITTKTILKKTLDVKKAERKRDDIERELFELGKIEAIINNTVATYTKYDENNYKEIIYSTQRNEFAKIKNYIFGECHDEFIQLCDNIEIFEAQGYVKDTDDEAYNNTEEALYQVRQLLQIKAEDLCKQEYYVDVAKNELKELINE